MTWTEPCAASAIFDTMLSRWAAPPPISIVLTEAHNRGTTFILKIAKENGSGKSLWIQEGADKIDTLLLLLKRCYDMFSNALYTWFHFPLCNSQCFLSKRSLHSGNLGFLFNHFGDCCLFLRNWIKLIVQLRVSRGLY